MWPMSLFRDRNIMSSRVLSYLFRGVRSRRWVSVRRGGRSLKSDSCNSFGPRGSGVKSTATRSQTQERVAEADNSGAEQRQGRRLRELLILGSSRDLDHHHAYSLRTFLSPRVWWRFRCATFGWLGELKCDFLLTLLHGALGSTSRSEAPVFDG